jgi:hypothetical protein
MRSSLRCVLPAQLRASLMMRTQRCRHAVAPDRGGPRLPWRRVRHLPAQHCHIAREPRPAMNRRIDVFLALDKKPGKLSWDVERRTRAAHRGINKVHVYRPYLTVSEAGPHTQQLLHSVPWMRCPALIMSPGGHGGKGNNPGRYGYMKVLSIKVVISCMRRACQSIPTNASANGSLVQSAACEACAASTLQNAASFRDRQP